MRNLKLDLQLASTTLRPTLGNWEFTKAGQTWDDFDKGKAEVVRQVRVQGRTYWITATRVQNDNFAVGIARVFGSREKFNSMYTHFNIYPHNPRQNPLGGTGFGTGQINRLPKVIRQGRQFDEQIAQIFPPKPDQK